MGWLLASAPGAVAHGGVPILQVGAERISPGGTIELVGDMTQEGLVEIVLVAPAAANVLSLGVVEADHEGHFRLFVAIPGVAKEGSYQVRAQLGAEQATTPIMIVGPPVAGEEGQLRGRDEAFAGVPQGGGSPGIIGDLDNVPTPASTKAPADLGLTALVVVVVIGGALALGLVARSRSGRVSRP